MTLDSRGVSHLSFSFGFMCWSFIVCNLFKFCWKVHRNQHLTRVSPRALLFWHFPPWEFDAPWWNASPTSVLHDFADFTDGQARNEFCHHTLGVWLHTCTIHHFTTFTITFVLGWSKVCNFVFGLVLHSPRFYNNYFSDWQMWIGTCSVTTT